MFRFPKDEQRCKKWVQNTRHEDIRNIPSHKLYSYELCSNHFEDSQFTDKEKKNRLIRNAVPTLFNVPNPPSKVTPTRSLKVRQLRTQKKKDIQHSEASVTASPLIEVETVDTPRKRKLKRKVKALCTKLWRKMNCKKLSRKRALNNLITQLKVYLPIQTVNFIGRQILLHQSKTAGRRYAITDKMMALSIFYQSQKAYKILLKLFALPSKRILQRSMQNTDVMPGFINTIFDALKLKVGTMDEKDRCVALVFDEMSLKSSLVYNHGLDKIEGFQDLGELGSSHFDADHALVFMVRGLLSKWKQPLAYFLTAGTVKSDDLQKLTRRCLDKLDEIGLHVKVLICDQGLNNRSFFETQEKVSLDKPYITHNNKKVFVMYDPPHLLKNVRNNFMKSNYTYDNVDIQWAYIVDFYNMDKAMSIRMAPKLTDKHITLPPFTAMRVNLATQVLSHSVAAGINALCNMEHLPDDASDTAEFIETFDQLFNAFNSRSLTSSHKYKGALSEKSPHIPFLQSCLRFLSKIKTGGNVVVPCLTGWQISITSLIHLWKELQNCGFKYLLTNRLNQDCLENLFSMI